MFVHILPDQQYELSLPDIKLKTSLFFLRKEKQVVNLNQTRFFFFLWLRKS